MIKINISNVRVNSIIALGSLNIGKTFFYDNKANTTFVECEPPEEDVQTQTLVMAEENEHSL
ncbi:hypothetical protein [Ammoniphilus sp. YIM 78166]|uniref:hypothetical protein n=1 Tax=Ammoniphilus sp. YIM 78166 TaxID=1644106 RepID=UPI0010703CF6|nr:hypothetical protein [Ammoniphilus sp. YIM 78166]